MRFFRYASLPGRRACDPENGVSPWRLGLRGRDCPGVGTPSRYCGRYGSVAGDAAAWEKSARLRIAEAALRETAQSPGEMPLRRKDRPVSATQRQRCGGRACSGEIGPSPDRRAGVAGDAPAWEKSARLRIAGAVLRETAQSPGRCRCAGKIGPSPDRRGGVSGDSAIFRETRRGLARRASVGRRARAAEGEPVAARAAIPAWEASG